MAAKRKTCTWLPVWLVPLLLLSTAIATPAQSLGALETIALQKSSADSSPCPAEAPQVLILHQGKWLSSDKDVSETCIAPVRGVLEDASYAQKTFGQAFSSEGTFAGRTVEDVAGALKSGAMKPGEVPIQYITRDGQTLILNTRSAQALEQAGIPRSQWNAVNMTGDAAAEARLTAQLQRNGLTNQGTSTVRPSGGN